MSPLEIMRERRAALKAELDELLALPTAEKRDLTDDESTKFDGLITQIRSADSRIAELEDEQRRADLAAETRKSAGETGVQRSDTGNAKVTDAPIYVRSGGNGNSYFRDLAAARLSEDRSALERLDRHSRMVADEQRALGNTNATGGSGGEFAPPEWLVQDYIKLARMGRVTADLYNKSEVPAGVSTVSIPKVATGTTVALQSTQNTALSQTDMTTTFVSTGFATVGGKQVVSQQLLDQSAINFDQVITQDLAAAYAQNIGAQIINGAGTGANNNSVVNGLLNAAVPAGNQITFTQATPTAQQLYGVAGQALSAFAANRFANPTAWLMHPRRWFWLATRSDSQGRPLVVPNAVAMNPMAVSEGAIPWSGSVGTFLGLPVYIDPQLPTNLGTGTNQDRIYLLKQDDLWLFESPVRAEAFREPYADTLGVLFRMYAYVGTILNRQAASIAYIDGTGLVAPTF